jgi:hypothetical protein
MRSPSPELLLESLAEALQTMAFVSPEPLPPDAPPPDAAECLTVSWSSPSAGTAAPAPRSGGGCVQLAAPRLFGELLAANILALEPGAPEIAARAVDALQELCNITAGGLLARCAESPADAPEMGLPSASTLPNPAAWRNFTLLPNTTAVLAEGYPVAIRFQESP